MVQAETILWSDKAIVEWGVPLLNGIVQEKGDVKVDSRKATPLICTEGSEIRQSVKHWYPLNQSRIRVQPGV